MMDNGWKKMLADCKCIHPSGVPLGSCLHNSAPLSRATQCTTKLASIHSTVQKASITTDSTAKSKHHYTALYSFIITM